MILETTSPYLSHQEAPLAELQALPSSSIHAGPSQIYLTHQCVLACAPQILSSFRAEPFTKRTLSKSQSPAFQPCFHTNLCMALRNTARPSQATGTAPNSRAIQIILDLRHFLAGLSSCFQKVLWSRRPRSVKCAWLPFCEPCLLKSSSVRKSYVTS